MKEITADSQLIGFCGLYCGACKRYLQEKCPGCKENAKASWCKVRSCGIENQYASCAECKTYNDPMECKKFNNFISKMFGLIFKSDRAACIAHIKKSGNTAYAAKMAGSKMHSIKKQPN